MREEVHLPCSLDGFNVCPELVPNARGHLKTAADLVPKSMRCHVVLPTSVVPVIQEKTVNCPPSLGTGCLRRASVAIHLDSTQ